MKNIVIFKSAPNDCVDCKLHEQRTQIVYPDVIKNSTDSFTTLVIGEAPGKNEDLQGKPFIGRSGKILKDKLCLIPGNVVITNTTKCRPEKNRDPRKSELDACRKYLNKEIEYYKPDLFLLIGRFACKVILPQESKNINFREINGKIFNDKIPIIHPAATLYNPNNKNIWNEAWETVNQYIISFGQKNNLELKMFKSPKDIKKKNLTSFLDK
ncbi:MAG: hypothetical protein HeimC3_54240 [Candidatus Heimdallarchaeota archaeon LC_3]|nr:MAG: hypothetical protein HeimC3_54240 [Candidatus Heimdallarchaeota archaeon LC_3]